MQYPFHLTSFLNGTVLVASDSESRLLYMKVLLTRHHYRVLTAANEEEACDQSLRWGESIDLAIMDTALCNRLPFNLYQQLCLAAPSCQDFYVGSLEEMRGTFYSQFIHNDNFLLFPFCMDTFLDCVRKRICKRSLSLDTILWNSTE